MTLNELISLVSDTETDLNYAFFQAKIFASRLDNLELLNWIEKEVNGYEEEDGFIPNYRIVRPSYQCTLTYTNFSVTYNSPLPVSWFDGRLKEKYFNNKAQVGRGIISLQHSLGNSTGDFAVKLPIDYDKAIDSETHAKSGGTEIRDVVILISDATIEQLLVTIRSKLLDLLLAVERKFPDLKEAESSPPHQKELINQTIHITMAKDSKTSISGTNITTSGSGNSVNANVGTGNTIDSTNISEAGQAIRDFVENVRSEMEPHEFPAKAALAQQLDRLVEEAQKPAPEPSVINTGLEVVHGLLLSVAANAWTEPILNALTSLKGIIGG